jgi:hypothetical protein
MTIILATQEAESRWIEVIPGQTVLKTLSPKNHKKGY